MAGTQMQLEDWLDDLCVRFIINLPKEDLSSVARLCFQVEEAQWFYEDFIRPLNPNLPSMSLRTFCLRIFQHCPLLASFSVENHTKAFEQFLEYKTRVPVRGAIMLNHAMDSVVLVKGWKKGANWSFPRGKINKDEDDLDCAVREVYEETGLDLRAADLVPTETKPKYIEISMREQQLRLYVFRDVPMNTNFEPRTRKEISKIEWYKLSELPAFRKKGAQAPQDSGAGSNANKFYMVAPFLVPLKKWIVSQKKIDERKTMIASYPAMHAHLTIDEAGTTEDDSWAPIQPNTSTRVPAIETLDGATQELQRLLKMQPPTQGLQPPPVQQDKGSALLSILQAGGSNSASVGRQNQHLVQTPFDHTHNEAPQSHNSQHHSNQHSAAVDFHQPPPSFGLAPSRVTPSWAPPQGFYQNQEYTPVPPAHGFQGNPVYQAHAKPASLVHPQPLPPQVQRAMFSNNTFQESLPGQAQNRSADLRPGSNQAQQASPHQHGVSPVPLNGQSMALLNAFKRDIGPPPPAQREPSHLHIHHEAPQIQQPGLHTANTSAPLQQNPTELAGSTPRQPADQHRSALLGMFKPAEPEVIHNQPQILATRQTTSKSPAASNQRKEDLLRHFQKATTSRDALSGAIDQLSIQSRPNPAKVNGGESPAASWQSRGAFVNEQREPQPTRILQRGESIPQLNFAHPGQRAPSQPGVSPGPSQMSSPGPADARPGVPPDQKRQLLSLFGRQQATPPNAHGGSERSRPQIPPLSSPAGGEAAYGSTPSSHRGRETPISPADQTFLLDYLQSVTNKAGR